MTTLKQNTAERVLRSTLSAVLQAGAEEGVPAAALVRLVAEQMAAHSGDPAPDESVQAVAQQVLRQVARRLLAAGTAVELVRSILKQAVDQAVDGALADVPSTRAQNEPGR